MPLAPRWRSLTLPILAGISLAVSGCQNGDPPPDEDESRPPAPKPIENSATASHDRIYGYGPPVIDLQNYVLDPNTGRLTLAPKKDEPVGVTPGNGDRPVPYQGWPEPPPQKEASGVGPNEPVAKPDEKAPTAKKENTKYPEKKYEVLSINGKIYLLDRATSRRYPDYNKDETSEEKDQGGPVKPPSKEVRPNVTQYNPVGPPSPEPAPLKLTDKDREAALKDIAAYLEYLSTSMIVKEGDDGVEGIIMVSNKGERQLEALEVTLLVPNGNKYELYPYLLQEGRKDVPPQPKPTNSAIPFPIYIKIAEPLTAPVTGKCDVKITYLKFAE